MVSAKGGSGATTLLVNLAAVLAQDGNRVCIVDMGLDPYAFGPMFEIKKEDIKFSLNDFILGKCKIEDTPIKLLDESAGRVQENLFIVLSSMDLNEQAKILREGYKVEVLDDGLQRLTELFDYVLIDTTHGLTEEGLVSMSIGDIVVINSESKYLLRPADMITVAKKLNVPALYVVLNLAPKKIIEIPVREFKNQFDCPLALIPNSADIRDEKGILAFNKPNHPIANLFRKIARQIVDTISAGNMVVSIEESEIKTLYPEHNAETSLSEINLNISETKLNVFLCHSPLDKPVVQELYQKLLFEGWVDPWLDKEKLLPGQIREVEIEKAMESTDVSIVFLSKNSVSKEGAVQKEIRKVLDVSEEKPEGEIFLIPVRLDDCEIPRNLSKWQWADYSDESAYQHIRKALLHRFQNLPRIRK